MRGVRGQGFESERGQHRLAHPAVYHNYSGGGDGVGDRPRVRLQPGAQIHEGCHPIVLAFDDLLWQYY